jgi:hypothetical protein
MGFLRWTVFLIVYNNGKHCVLLKLYESLYNDAKNNRTSLFFECTKVIPTWKQDAGLRLHLTTGREALIVAYDGYGMYYFN